MSKIGVKKRRKPIWAEKGDHFTCCPDCGSGLINESNTFLVGGNVERELETFLMSNQADFCEKCPVVVLKKVQFDFSLFAGNSGVEHYEVAGIVDLDAIPEDERDIPVGSGDTPIKLMEFIKSSPKTSSKVERNAPCPCGSGKKYKKCCALVEV